MSKDPQDRNRMPGQDEGGEEMEKMPKKDQKNQQGQQGWNQGQKGEQGGRPRKVDEMNRPKDTDEKVDERTRRPA